LETVDVVEVVKVIRKTYEIDPKKIRIARAEKGWTKQKLAVEAGIARHTVINLEKNQRKSVNFITIQKIAKALGKRIEDFVKEETEGK